MLKPRSVIPYAGITTGSVDDWPGFFVGRLKRISAIRVNPAALRPTPEQDRSRSSEAPNGTGNVRLQPPAVMRCQPLPQTGGAEDDLLQPIEVSLLRWPDRRIR